MSQGFFCKDQNCSSMLTQTLALQMWCLATPPPKMIIPEELAANAVLFILDMSEVKHVSLDQLKVHLHYIWLRQ